MKMPGMKQSAAENLSKAQAVKDATIHGRTLATLTATGQDVFHKDFGPFPANFGYIPANDFDTFKAAVDDSVCAVMMEMVQGEGGVVALDADYVQSVA